MTRKYRIVKGKKIPIWEHLDWTLEKTTYADRWQWLEEAHQFVRLAQKKKNIK